MTTQKGGLAQLGDITFRINPTSVDWNFAVATNVINTVGGRVVQVLGAQLSDITVKGNYGEDHDTSARWLRTHPNADTNNAPGRSWKMADGFVDAVRQLMDAQAPSPGLLVSQSGYLPPNPVRFYYPSRRWDFQVYIRGISDLKGGNSVNHATDKFSYGYSITLIPVSDNTLHLTGDKDSLDLQQMKDAAVSKAIARISDGLGWHLTAFNDPYSEVLSINDLNGTNSTPAATPAQKSATANTPDGYVRLPSGKLIPD